MPNSQSNQGQLQRSGVQRLISDKRGKKRRKLVASKVRESIGLHKAFLEQGIDEQDKKTGKKNRKYLVTIIEEGLGNSKDKNFYSAEALQSGVQAFNGAKAYADHPDAITEKTLPERSMKDLVGWYSDCFVDKNPQTNKTRLRGKLHFFPSAKWLTDMIDTILTDPTAKNLFGISINAVGKTRQGQMGGEEVNYVEQFQRVDSADVVTEPAARGKFDKMLESRRGKVTRIMHRNTKRTREAASLSPEKLKEVADSLVSAYNSDSPDEVKEAAFEASKVLHAAASISGKGPGQSNEEQYSNISPNGGRESMAGNKKRVKTSTGGRHSFRKGKRRLQAAAGTGEDNEHIDEPDEGDIEPRLEEADVEDEEERGDLGDQQEHGSSRYHQVKASREALEDEGLEDEGLEDEGLEDEGFEDEGLEDEGLEDEDEHDMGGMPPGGTPGAGMGAPAGGGAPGSSRTVASAEADDDDEDDDDDDDDDDLDDMDESLEDEHDMVRPGVVAESRNRRRMKTSRGRRLSREADGSSQGGPIKRASYAGGLGHSGHSALPKGADPSRGYDDSDEDWGKEDSSTSGVGKSYKLKTSRFARNRRQAKVAKPIVREANRRIEHLSGLVARLRESNRAKDQKIDRYRGKMRFIESDKSARRLLREAVKKEIIPENAPNTLYPILLGLNEKQQIREIKRAAYFLESATEGALSRLTESVEGSGARGGFASWGSAGQNSELQDGLASLGVPMKQEEE
jgi:hypothetical protein